MKKTFILLFVFGLLFPKVSWAQKEEKVHGSYTFALGWNDNITLNEARHRCIELAKAEAIKEKFGELITMDVISDDIDTGGSDSKSFFWENTVAKAKGIWLTDEKEPEISVSYINNKLLIKAEVWGWAREIIQAQTELKWKVLTNDERETDSFKSGDPFYVRFRSPADGYVAIYLNTEDDETACLLPYKQNSKGQHFIKRNTDYLFFDKKRDSSATPYALTVDDEVERFRLVIIYSPNPFTKCNDNTGDKRHPNSLNSHDFQKWLLNLQRHDKDMVVNTKSVIVRKQ